MAVVVVHRSEATMRAKTVDGTEFELSDSAVSQWRARLRGPVVTSGDVEYENSRTVWNGMIDRHPALIARCIGSSDVIECVRFAREQNLLLCIKGGGHNIAGLRSEERRVGQECRSG